MKLGLYIIKVDERLVDMRNPNVKSDSRKLEIDFPCPRSSKMRLGPYIIKVDEMYRG